MSFYSFLLWAQFSFSLWQFSREAKFLKIPYSIISSVWNSRLYDSIPKRRRFYQAVWTAGEGEEEFEYNFLGGRKYKIEGFNEESTFLSGGVIFSDSDYVVDRANNVVNLLESGAIISCADPDMLWPGFYLVKQGTRDEILELVLKRYCFVVKEEWTIVDFSDKNVLNQNFLRLFSIFPLMLQAKGYQILSTILSLVLISMDLTSYMCNKIWLRFKSYIFRFVKYLISFIKNPVSRRNFHVFLSSISDGFMYCDDIRNMAYTLEIKDIALTRGSLSQIDIDEIEDIFYSSEAETPDTINLPLSFRYNGLDFILNSTYIEEEDLFDVEISNEGKTIYSDSYDKSRLFNLIRGINFISKEGRIFVKTVKGSKAHINSYRGVFTSIDQDFCVVVLKKGKTLYISDHELETRILFRFTPYDEKTVKRLISHNVLFFKKLITGHIIKALNSTFSKRPEGTGNSEWKKYLSDVNLILVSSGYDGKKGIKCCGPSYSLKNVLTESFHLEGLENLYRKYYNPNDKIIKEKREGRKVLELYNEKVLNEIYPDLTKFKDVLKTKKSSKENKPDYSYGQVQLDSKEVKGGTKLITKIGCYLNTFLKGREKGGEEGKGKEKEKEREEKKKKGKREGEIDENKNKNKMGSFESIFRENLEKNEKRENEYKSFQSKSEKLSWTGVVVNGVESSYIKEIKLKDRKESLLRSAEDVKKSVFKWKELRSTIDLNEKVLSGLKEEMVTLEKEREEIKVDKSDYIYFRNSPCENKQQRKAFKKGKKVDYKSLSYYNIKKEKFEEIMNNDPDKEKMVRDLVIDGVEGEVDLRDSLKVSLAKSMLEKRGDINMKLKNRFSILSDLESKINDDKYDAEHILGKKVVESTKSLGLEIIVCNKEGSITINETSDLEEDGKKGKGEEGMKERGKEKEEGEERGIKLSNKPWGKRGPRRKKKGGNKDGGKGIPYIDDDDIDILNKLKIICYGSPLSTTPPFCKNEAKEERERTQEKNHDKIDRLSCGVVKLGYSFDEIKSVSEVHINDALQKMGFESRGLGMTLMGKVSLLDPKMKKEIIKSCINRLKAEDQDRRNKCRDVFKTKCTKRVLGMIFYGVSGIIPSGYEVSEKLNVGEIEEVTRCDEFIKFRNTVVGKLEDDLKGILVSEKR